MTVLSGERERQSLAVAIASSSRRLLKREAAPADESEAGRKGIDDELQQKLQSSLVRAVSDLLKLESEDIDPEAELSEFGFDSITLTAFANVINGMYGLELTPTVLFEYPTLAGLSEHLLHEYRTVLAKQLGDTVRATAPELSDASVSAALPMGRSQRVRFAQAPAMPPKDMQRPRPRPRFLSSRSRSRSSA
ncbi:acyl carrier protein [Variovorax sp. NFACC29]|uniref:acyl carrier protein n=1 Tax=Variovorax sp. NFACC29 TaxID=1566272 RepID=UPI003AAC4523